MLSGWKAVLQHEWEVQFVLHRNRHFSNEIILCGVRKRVCLFKFKDTDKLSVQMNMWMACVRRFTVPYLGIQSTLKHISLHKSDNRDCAYELRTFVYAQHTALTHVRAWRMPGQPCHFRTKSTKICELASGAKLLCEWTTVVLPFPKCDYRTINSFLLTSKIE